MLCLTIPGNPNPIVENRKEENSHMGKPIQSGYQSNYVLTTLDGNPCDRIFREGEVYYDELILDQEAQVVPVAIIELYTEKLMPVASKFKRDTSAISRGVSSRVKLLDENVSKKDDSTVSDEREDETSTSSTQAVSQHESNQTDSSGNSS